MAALIHYIFIAVLTPSALCVALRNNSYGENFYVSSNRKGCVAVRSQQPCPASTLNPDIAVGYTYDGETIESMIEETKINNASDECISALTTTLCSTLTPRCFVNGSKDYGDARVACWKANKTCPSDSLEEGECESLKTGLYKLSACVKPSKPINGSCPQPKYKMPADKLDLYKRSSEEYEKISYFEPMTTARFPNQTLMFSAQCVSNIKELYCLPFYCSADEQQILVKYTYEDCDEILQDCFEPVIDQLSGDAKEDMIDLRDRYGDNCVFYPDAVPSPGSGKPPENTTSAPSGQNVSSTTPRQNLSTTPPEKTESSLAPTDSKQSTPFERTTSFLLTPSPTCGTQRCKNFPLLSLLFLLVLLEIN